MPLAAAACGTGSGATDCLGKVFANGKLRNAAFQESTISLNQSSPELATDRPYAVDLTGWFEGYSHPGIIDANGGASRIQTVFGPLSIATGLTAPADCDPPAVRWPPGHQPQRRVAAHDQPGRPLPRLAGARRPLLPRAGLPV